MTLKELINSIPAKTKYEARKQIAEAIGFKEISIRSMANGNRRITAETAKAIARAFPNKISPADLRPDIFE